MGHLGTAACKENTVPRLAPSPAHRCNNPKSQTHLLVTPQQGHCPAKVINSENQFLQRKLSQE